MTTAITQTNWQSFAQVNSKLVSGVTAAVAAALLLVPVLWLRGRRLSGSARAIPWGTAAAIGVLFLILTFRAQGLPVVKGQVR